MQHGCHPQSVAQPRGICLHVGALATLFLGISHLKEVVEGDLLSLCTVVNLSNHTWHVILLLVYVAYNPSVIWIYQDLNLGIVESSRLIIISLQT